MVEKGQQLSFLCTKKLALVFYGSTISGVDIEISLSIPIPDFYV